MAKKKTQEIKEAKMLCPYCNAEFTPEMQADYAWAKEGCPTCGFGSEVCMSISIYCTACKRLVYRKEITRET